MVDVDTASGAIAIERYVVAHDCGVVINPMLVDGQVVGGTVQGLGGALLEDAVDGVDHRAFSPGSTYTNPICSTPALLIVSTTAITRP